MKPAETAQPLHPVDEFADLVHKLRLDFRRLFPHLRSRESECFFVRQNADQTSGKVWIECIQERDGRQVKCTIAITIKDNRAVRRVQQEFELDESLENTDPCAHQYLARVG